MSAYIPSHQTIRSHPKTRKLAILLGVPVVQAIGHLHCLWWWAIDYAPGGMLNGHDDLDIAIGCEWEGDPETFVKALEDAGWLDGREIHDWYDYYGKVEEFKAAERERQRAYRAKKKAEQTKDDDSAYGVRTADVQGVYVKEDKIREERALALAFDEWWVAYGRVGNKAKAKDCYAYWLGKGFTPDRLLEAVAPYLADCAANDRSVMHASTFLTKKYNAWEEYITEEHGTMKPSSSSPQPTEEPEPGFRWACIIDPWTEKKEWQQVEA